MTGQNEKTINFAIIAVALIGGIALIGLIIVLFVPLPNEGAREVTVALAAIVSTALGGLVFLMKKVAPNDPPVPPVDDRTKSF